MQIRCSLPVLLPGILQALWGEGDHEQQAGWEPFLELVGLTKLRGLGGLGQLLEPQTLRRQEGLCWANLRKEDIFCVWEGERWVPASSGYPVVATGGGWDCWLHGCGVISQALFILTLGLKKM